MEAAEQFQAEHAGEFGDLDEVEDDESLNDAPIVKIVNTILDESVRMESSDVHISQKRTCSHGCTYQNRFRT